MAVSASTAATGLQGVDTRPLDALRATAAKDPKAAIREAAKQFEALFMQQLMKSMRDASMSSGMLDNEGTRMGTDMLDTQLATKMTGLPGGLADLIARQLERQMNGGTDAPAAAAGTAPAAGAPGSGGTGVDRITPAQADFVRRHGDEARAAQAASGIPAAFVLAQAAHESAWGQREIRNADGSSSHNLFGIKAGAGWNGPVAEVTTTEWNQGAAQKVAQKFRAYGSYAEAFQDYARLIAQSPRYAAVMRQVASGSTPQGFAAGLQKAGYATDPAYADKLARVINTTLRMQRAVT
ncbi:MAG TPA: flagellar assembly peptidoglycan hydrolase FlgJ [Caldimonas sp.]|nr:flagellar assembly peptidoglycan hydrolase FlgJ [Caldimonas sp.]